MDEHDDCEPRLLRRFSLLLSTKSCSVFLLSAAALADVLLRGLDSDDTLLTLLAMLLMLLLLLVRLRPPLLPSAAVKEDAPCMRALMDAEYARRASSADWRLGVESSAARGPKSLLMPTRCTFFSRARGVVLAAIPSRPPVEERVAARCLVVGEAADVADLLPGVWMREILLGVRNLEPGMRPDVEMTRRDVTDSVPSIDSLSSVNSSSPVAAALVSSWASSASVSSAAVTETSSGPSASIGSRASSSMATQEDPRSLLVK